MSDQNVREIQLGGKQLVFLFMASVVLAVAIFLLGISVGRGVQSASGESPDDTDVSLTEAPVPDEMPPPTETTPEDLSYHNQLQGQTPPPAESGPAPAPVKPIEQPASAAEVPPAPTGRTAAATAKPSAPAVTEPARPAPTASAARTGAGAASFFVQAGAFGSRQNADRQAAQLRAKGYPGTSVTADPTRALFLVRIGPLDDRAEADQMVQRLLRDERIKATVQR
jgi:cell division protein FtsN